MKVIDIISRLIATNVRLTQTKIDSDDVLVCATVWQGDPLFIPAEMLELRVYALSLSADRSYLEIHVFAK